MARNMESATKTSFPNAQLVTDRFHVIKLASEALQHIRINLRWSELDIENKAIEEAKKAGLKYKVQELENGDTPKQLLARCRYVFARKPYQWTDSQKRRAELAFKLYPHLESAYRHVVDFREIYECTTASQAKERLSKWIERTAELKIKEFNTVAHTVKYNLDNILNFFTNRSTNANAESFNSKIKLFRANLRGV